MILGIGLDVTAVSRFERVWNKFGPRFARKILHAAELDRFATRGNDAARFLASRFAAKEAASKALGVGFSEGVSPGDIRVETLSSGKPALRLSGKAEERLNLLGANRAHLSITHDKETVAALVILEKI